MHFSSAVSSIQSHVGQIKGVEISYCEKNPLAYDLSIKLSQEKVRVNVNKTRLKLNNINSNNLLPS